jgi:hypothetical protein
MKHFPLKDRHVIDVTIVEGGAKMFGGKLAEEVFSAKGFPFLEVKRHGTSLDVRLLELGLQLQKKKMMKFKAYMRFQRCHS